MDKHTATEIAYKNGYEQGMKDAAAAAAAEIAELKSELELWKTERFNIYQTTQCHDRAVARAAREIFEEIEKLILRYFNNEWYTVPDMWCDVEMLKQKYAPDICVGDKTEVTP